MIEHDTGLLEKLRGLKDFLLGEIIGQDSAIEAIVPYLQAGELGLAPPTRPKASFLFLGPTGVGKSELANCFTQYLFGQGHMVRLDMSEYQHPDSIDRLLGNLNSPSLLQAKMVGIGKGTLLLDEIEKAHPAILDLLLQILDVGCLTLADGTELDFSSYFIVLTSNIGSLAIARSKQSGTALERVIQAMAQRYLRPELVARLDEVVVFQRLDEKAQGQIQQKFVEKEARRLGLLGYHVDEIDLSSATTANGGARFIRSEVESELRGQILRKIFPMRK
jgi:ATP-dependent Clp protease ATP-binding subunit ClpA